MNVTCTCWRIFMINWQKSPRSQTLWITINTRVTSIKVTEEPTAPLSVAVRGNGRRNCSFISSTSQFQTATFSWSPVILQFYTVTSDWHSWGPQPRSLQTVRRPSTLATRIGRLVESSRRHWLAATETTTDCVVCYARTKKRRRIRSVKSVMLGCAYPDV